MSLYNVPVLPRPHRLEGQVSIPPPSSNDFNALFGGILPPAQTVTSYWGKTTFYIIKPSHSNLSSETPRRVVLVHGLGTPAIGLLPLATLLAASFVPTTVLIYDNWGHGLSSTPLAPHVPGLYHTQILQLLAHLGWSSAHFLGFSQGGLTTVTFTEFYPSLVESLVLVAPAGLKKKTNLSVWERFIQWGGWGWGWEDISARHLFDLLGPGPVEKDWELKFKEKGLEAIPRNAIQIWEKEKHAGHVASVISFYRHGGLYDSDQSYMNVAAGNIPTMALLGEHDTFFVADYMVEQFKSVGWKGKVEVIKGVGHGVVAEKTKEVGERLLEFWGNL